MKPFKVFLLVVFLFSTPQAASPLSQHDFRWRDYYQPIQDKHARLLLYKALEYVTAHLGNPSQKIKEIHLCLSRPKDKHAHIKKDFQLTEINDFSGGEFTIYLSHQPSESAFLGRLVHEITHLLDPRIHDPYMEGLSTVMAERYYKEQGLDWNAWLAYFQSGQDPFYARTYFMMREIYAAAGEEHMRNFHTYTKSDPARPEHLHIDTERWLQNLAPEARSRVKGIIDRYNSPVPLSKL